MDAGELPIAFEGQAEIYLFDAESEHFVVQGDVRLIIIEKDVKNFDCEWTLISFCFFSGGGADGVDGREDWFACQLLEGEQYIITQPIDGEMNSRWSQVRFLFSLSNVAS